MDFDDLKAELNGQSAEDTRKADNAEAVQRMAEIGVEACTPMESLKRVVALFDAPGNEAAVIEKMEELKKLPAPRVIQAVYDLMGAKRAVENFSQALAVIAMARMLAGEEGFDVLKGKETGF